MRRRLAVVGATVFLAAVLVPQAFATGFQVNTAADQDDSGCGATCSLRDAIIAANATPGADIITFDPAHGPYLIRPTTALPQINESVTIDGANTDVQIDGTSAGATLYGFDFVAGAASFVNDVSITKWNVNNGVGIYVRSGANVTVTNSNIGTNSNSDPGIGNYGGIQVDGVATIGGAGGQNIVAGNTTGIYVTGSAAIQGNVIGKSGSALGNGIQGILVQSASTNVQIGGTTSGEGNTIRDNAGDGVKLVDSVTKVPVRRNEISGNGLAGIDLVNGANGNQAAPVLAPASADGNDITVDGTLTSTPNKTFEIDLFTSSSCSSPPQGETFLGVAAVTTDGSGQGSFEAQTSSPTTSGFVTATATGANGTSTFSACASIVTGQTFTVTMFSDTGNGVCGAACSLRDAIDASNTSPGHDLIRFNIPGGGIQSLVVNGDLPTITDPVDIDGSSNGAPDVELAPSEGGGTGLDITAGSSTVRGLIIHGFDTQIVLGTGGNNTIAGNWLGLGADGLTSFDDTAGIKLNDSGGNTIGGTSPADRNVITTIAGIDIGSPGGNVVEGNYIGIDTTGDVAPGNSGTGVGIQVTGGDTNTIGAPGAGNHIWSFQEGIYLIGTSDNTVAGNSVGTTADESAVVYPGDTGIQIDPTSAGNEIGGATVAAGNVIAGMGDTGLLIRDGGNTIEGNFIGASRTGVDYSDTNDQGIRQIGSSGPNTYRNNIIDGSNDIGFELDNGDGTQIVGNTFRNNNNTSIFVAPSRAGITISKNSIFENFEDGIVLGNENTPSANLDTSAPTIDTAEISGGNVSGSISLASVHDTTFHVEVFRSSDGCPSVAQGETYLGTVDIGTDEAGNGSSNFSFPAVGSGDGITATATNDSSGSTSIFSDCVTASQSAYVVNTATDSDDGSCAAVCSLRDAINAANGDGQPSTISFSIGGGTGTQTIQLQSQLPAITDTVTIDGTTQVADAGTKGIVLQGPIGAPGLDLALSSDNSTVKGLAIQGFTGGNGILVESNGNLIEDNYIGTTADGSGAAPNGVGVDVTGSATGNQIGQAGDGNVISGNADFDIRIGTPDGSNNVVAGNIVGWDVTGNVPLSMGSTAIEVENGSYQTTVGGFGPADGNRVYGFTGIDVTQPIGQTKSTEIIGNTVGVAADPLATFPNMGTWGIGVNGGGDDTVSNNVVGHAESGMAITDTAGPTISGNFVGVDRNGNPQPNTYEGIYVSSNSATSSGFTVDDNQVRFNPRTGIHFQGDSSQFSHNQIDHNGATGDPGQNEGIRITGDANQIEQNTITANEGPGVAIVSGTGNQIADNSIDGNGSIGIDLGDNGKTPNGQLGHAGPNLYQNFPSIDGAALNANNSVTINYDLSSADGSYTVEFFSSPSCDPSGNGEGAQFLGSDQVTVSGGTGSGTITFDNAATQALSVGTPITATATDSNENTSEFSACFAATAGVGNGSLSGSADQTPDTHANLTAAGTTDWVGWGWNGSISVTPSLRKVGGAGISDLSQQAGDGPPRNFATGPDYAVPNVPFGFDWSDGAPTASATAASLGITAPQVGQGYSFTVPADTTPRTLTVWTSAHLATGHFTAVLSDGSAPDFTYDLVSAGQEVSPGGQNIPAVFKITYTAASAGQHLTVTWTETAISGQFDDIVIYAAALSGAEQPTGASAALSADPAVQISGSNDSIASLPLAAFNQGVSGATQTPNGLPLNGLPLNGLPLNGLPLNGLPLNGLPLNGLPLNGLPLNGLPLNGLPLNGLPLNGLPLNGLPLNGLSWSTLLAGTPLADKPLQTLTLADVFELPDPPHLTLGQLDLSGTILGKQTLGALALANLPLNGLDLPADAVQTLVDWCRSFDPTSADCTTATRLGQYSLFALGLAGAPLNGLPLNGLPLNGLPLNGLSTTVPAIQASPLNGLPLNGLELSASPLNGLPLNGLPLNGLLVGCAAGATGCVTLGEAAASGHLAPNATIGDLFTVLTDPASPVRNTVTLGDLMSILIKRNDVPWETLPPRLLSAFDPGRHEASVTASVTLAGPAGGQAQANISVKLPAGFDYVPGSSTDATTGDPQIDASTNTLTWSVQATFGTPASVSFKVWSGTDVGPARLTEDVSSGNAADTAATPIDVTDSFSGNTTTAGAQPVTPNQNVELSALPSAGSVDYYKIPLPAAGTRLEVHLTNLPADFDLALYANQSTTVRTDATAGLALQDGTVPDTTVNLQGATNPQLTPTALQDIPDPGIPVVQVSANRGTDDEDVGMVSPGSGFAYVAVFGYNGASSPLPYSLRVKTISPPQQLICPARTFAHPSDGSAGALPGTFAANVNTLFLVNEQRYGKTYGADAESNLVDQLDEVAGRGDLGVSGAVIPVEAVAGAQYAAWDQQPCSPGAANDVANAIADEVATLKAAHPTIKYVVFVGGDDQVPFFRIPDLSRIANENGFASQFSPNEYWGALANSDLLTDDPYLDTRPVPASGRQLFIPDLVGGRLTEESGHDALDAIQRFEDSSGTLDTNTAFVSGYDFVTDGSQQVSQALGKNGLLNTPLLGDWSTSDLLGATHFAGGINDWNGHFDNTRALTANGEVFGTSDLGALPDKFSGGIFFTMGCHAGFQTTDAIVGAQTLDWAQYFAGTGTGFVGNTGYGLGNTDSVAFSEELMTDFATNLDGSKSIGDALAEAKSRYYLSRLAFSPYDEKTLSEAELYGMPMYGVGTAPQALAAVHNDTRLSAIHADTVLPTVPGTTGTAVTPDQSALAGFPGSSVQAAPFDVTPDFSEVQHGANGDYLTNAGQVQAPNYRPLQPYVSLPATRSGLTAHGVVIDSLTSSDITPFNPDNVRPTLDLSANEPEPQFGDEAWPEKVPTLVSLDDANGLQQSVNLATGQFFTQTSSSATSGVERKWTHVGGRVTYSTSQDFVLPTIDSINAFTVDPGPNQRVSFTGHFSDLDEHGNPGTVAFAQIVYDLEDNTGNWGVIPLVLDPVSSAWTGGAPFTADHIQYFVVVCDAAGNCGYSSNKGRYFDAQALPSVQSAITVAPSGTQLGAFYTGIVGITTSAPPGVTVQVSVDGGPFVDPQTVHLTGDGAHTIDAKGSDGSAASTAVIIDNTPPTVLFSLPTDVRIGDTVPVTYACADSGSGIATCDGNVTAGSLLNTGSAGDVVIQVTATDAVGRHTTLSQTVHVRSGPSAPGKPAATPAPNQGTFTVSWAASTDDSGQSLTYDLQRATAPAGPWTPVATGLTGTSAPQAGLGQGSYSYRVVAKDATLSATSSVSDAVIVDTTPPTAQITSGCPTTHVDPGATVTVTFTASDTGGSGLQTPASGTVSKTIGAGPTESVDVVARDNAGNTGTASCQVSVNRAPTKPGQPSTSTSPNQGAFTLTWTASTDPDNDAITYTLQHKPATGGSFSNVATAITSNSYSFTSGGRETEGTWVYKVIAKDATLSGLASDQSASVVVDRSAPNAPTLSPAGTLLSGWYKDSVVVTTAANGDPNLVDGSPGSGIDATQTSGAQTKSTSGTFLVTGSVADRAGNVKSASITVKVDATSPTLNLPCPSTPIPYGTATTVPWTASDGESGLSTSPSGTLTLNTSQHPGAYTSAPVTATDKVTHSTTKSCTFTIVKATPAITWASPAQILFGTPLSSTQLNATAPIAGTFTYTPPSGTVLQPGNGQTLSVTFSPSNTTDYNPATASVLINVGFSQACLTTSLSGSITVKSNQAYCIQSGGKVSGSITVQSGGSLYVSGGSVSGSITATGARALTICATALSGSLSVSGGTGPVIVGAATGCTKNTISGSVTLTSNTKGVSLVGNTISGSVTASSNSGGTAVSGNTVSQSVTVNGNTGGITVTNDKISKSLTVTNNKGGYTINGNVVGGSTTISGNS